MSNKFISFLEAAGKDFKKGLDVLLPYAAGPAEVAVSLFAPSLGPLFNQTVNAVITAEQSAAAAGKQAKTGTAKASAVVSIAGPLIAQGLADVGKANDDAAVQKYIDSVVTVLNVAPAPAPTA